LDLRRNETVQDDVARQRKEIGQQEREIEKVGSSGKIGWSGDSTRSTKSSYQSETRSTSEARQEQLFRPDLGKTQVKQTKPVEDMTGSGRKGDNPEGKEAVPGAVPVPLPSKATQSGIEGRGLTLVSASEVSREIQRWRRRAVDTPRKGLIWGNVPSLGSLPSSNTTRSSRATASSQAANASGAGQSAVRGPTMYMFTPQPARLTDSILDSPEPSATLLARRGAPRMERVCAYPATQSRTARSESGKGRTTGSSAAPSTQRAEQGVTRFRGQRAQDQSCGDSSQDYSTQDDALRRQRNPRPGGHGRPDGHKLRMFIYGYQPGTENWVLCLDLDDEGVLLKESSGEIYFQDDDDDDDDDVEVRLLQRLLDQGHHDDLRRSLLRLDQRHLVERTLVTVFSPHDRHTYRRLIVNITTPWTWPLSKSKDCCGQVLAFLKGEGLVDIDAGEMYIKIEQE
jgi:hypothetical protein